MKSVALAALLLVASACSWTYGDGPSVTMARVAASEGPDAAVYMTVHPYGNPDRLVGVRTDSAVSVELHETVFGPDGSATMGPLTNLFLPARRPLVLEPGGLHLMLIQVNPLAVGDVVRMTLIWEQAGEIEVDVSVVDHSDTVVDDDQQSHD